MTELLTAAQMRSLEAAAIASGQVTGLELMDRAGRGVVEAVFAEWPEMAAGSYRAVVLCGPGGNGGDGYVVARLLRDWGWEVEVFALAAAVSSDAVVMQSRWGHEVRALSALDWPDLAGAPLVVDAMFGGGLTRNIAPGVWGTLSMAQSNGCKIVAVDIVSGVCADSGRVRSADFIEAAADLTVTFQRPRVGHYLGQGAALSGRLVVMPLGLKRQMDDLLRTDGDGVVDLDWVRVSALPKVAGHKFGYGHALVLSGGVGHGGAARLAARGALRIGAGVVTLGCPPSAVIENASRLDAVMLARVGDAEALAGVLADKRINAVCLGPGMGVSRAKELLPVVLAAGRSVVLDADGLTALAEDPALFALLHDRCVLTPHGGEFARLFPDIAARLAALAVTGPAYSKVDACREAAARAGCVVLCKGADTVIADPAGHCSINSASYDRSAPWLATAGSGDVLAGFITGLLARGMPPMQAAETAAWLHVECARSFGPGLIAEDLAQELPPVFRALGL